MAKWRRISAENRLHFVTFTIDGFRPVFNNSHAAHLMISILRFYENRTDYKLHAFVVMPEHVHILLERREDRLIGHIIRDVKKYSAYIDSGPNTVLNKTRSGWAINNRERFGCSNGDMTK